MNGAGSIGAISSAFVLTSEIFEPKSRVMALQVAQVQGENSLTPTLAVGLCEDDLVFILNILSSKAFCDHSEFSSNERSSIIRFLYNKLFVTSNKGSFWSGTSFYGYSGVLYP